MNFQQFKDFVKSWLITLYQNNEIPSIVRFVPHITRFFLLDLDYLRTLLVPTYNKPHHKPRDPVPLFRSLLLMTLIKETSITRWVEKLKEHKVYAILSGFKPDAIPGIGTFYDFIDRLVLLNKDLKRKRRNRLKKFKRKPKKKLKKNQKLPPKHPVIVEKIVQRILRNFNQPNQGGQYKLIYQFFIHSVVEQSAQMGLLGEVEHLIVAGDGTHIETGSSPYGTKVCECKKFVIENGKKIFNRCECSRKFSDLNAVWGWDSYREQWVYGYSFYDLTVANGQFDLPLFFIQTQANRHDSIAAPVTLDLAHKLLSDHYHIAEFLADSAHDNMPFYKLLKQFECEPFIPLNQRNTGHFTYKKCQINEQGIPICPAGKAMVYQGFCPDRMRIKFRCPLKALKNFSETEACKKNNYCTDSPYGRVVYTSHKDNLRLFTKTPRGSEQWLAKYDRRSSAERSNKRKKIDFRIQQAQVRSKEQWFVRYALAAICQHLDAWAKTTDFNFKELCLSWQADAG
jgi:hypothetical protein